LYLLVLGGLLLVARRIALSTDKHCSLGKCVVVAVPGSAQTAEIK
jgi:hypothetical protein